MIVYAPAISRCHTHSQRHVIRKEESTVPAVLKDLGSWFWRLVPANPILVRVVQSGGRRLRHLWIRLGYLTIIAVAVVFGIGQSRDRKGAVGV